MAQRFPRAAQRKKAEIGRASSAPNTESFSMDARSSQHGQAARLIFEADTPRHEVLPIALVKRAYTARCDPRDER